MREDNLLCLRRKRAFTRTTAARHSQPIYPNFAREMVVTSINQLWVSDITYIRLEREFIYLAVIMDAFSRRVVGWALEPYLDAELTMAPRRFAQFGPASYIIPQRRAVCLFRLHRVACQT